MSLLALGLVPQMPLGWEGWRWVTVIAAAGAIFVGFMVAYFLRDYGTVGVFVVIAAMGPAPRWRFRGKPR